MSQILANKVSFFLTQQLECCVGWITMEQEQYVCTFLKLLCMNALPSLFINLNQSYKKLFVFYCCSRSPWGFKSQFIFLIHLQGTVERLPDKGEKLQKQIAELNLKLKKLRTDERSETEVIDVDDIMGNFKRVLNVWTIYAAGDVWWHWSKYCRWDKTISLDG